MHRVLPVSVLFELSPQITDSTEEPASEPAATIRLRIPGRKPVFWLRSDSVVGSADDVVVGITRKLAKKFPYRV